ncbi:aspartate/glutamate racemase family protein [uncultured Shewanella sp.]|uniref:aspartate/glutamate racemase family protein n=1 Tax=uncultured Shewanella sp. TaxID=173975 RepID=UPI0026077FFC|nr:aspartate/glutamate racemase family protein [uncultured Shewanella sp.]
MKTIGLLGGMSWESTLSYYQGLNQEIKASLGGLNSAKVCLYSINFDEIEKHQRLGQWDEAAKILSKAAQNIEAGGADFLLICTNTMHKVAPQIETAINIPLLHIADATAQQLAQDGMEKVGLLGTKFTMEQDFYKRRITDKFGIEIITPNQDERQAIHDIIYQELCLGVISNSSRTRYLEIINKLHQQGAQAVILGCTEIGLLVNKSDTNVPLYDTTELHMQAAIDIALSNSEEIMLCNDSD